MERLTRVIKPNVVVYVGKHKNYDVDIPAEVSVAGIRELLCKVAAYEDTGLTPEQVTAQQWVPVTEKLPVAEYEKHQKEYGTDPEFIVVISGAKESTTLRFGKDFKGRYCWYDEDDNYSVSHWMNWPQPPKEVNQ